MRVQGSAHRAQSGQGQNPISLLEVPSSAGGGEGGPGKLVRRREKRRPGPGRQRGRRPSGGPQDAEWTGSATGGSARPAGALPPRLCVAPRASPEKRLRSSRAASLRLAPASCWPSHSGDSDMGAREGRARLGTWPARRACGQPGEGVPEGRLWGLRQPRGSSLQQSAKFFPVTALQATALFRFGLRKPSLSWSWKALGSKTQSAGSPWGAQGRVASECPRFRSTAGGPGRPAEHLGHPDCCMAGGTEAQRVPPPFPWPSTQGGARPRTPQPLLGSLPLSSLRRL